MIPPIDRIFPDIQMRLVDGLRAAEQVRQNHKADYSSLTRTAEKEKA